MLKRLFRRTAGEPSEPEPIADRRIAARPPMRLRVSMIIHNPVLERKGGQKLNAAMGWHDPDDLARQYSADLRACSGGIADYEIVERIEADDYPAKIDGFRYDDASYLRCVRQRSGCHQPDAVDYHALLNTFDLFGKIERRVIDEIWLFGFPYAGYYESTMAGTGAIWCNSPPISHTEHITRRFIVMGFNYERDVGCMLENFGHRVESIMQHIYRNHSGERNLWARFIRYDRDAPGQAECGNVHFAPNSVADYDWGNARRVPSRADAWYAFPDLSAPPRSMECREWGGGDMRGHHLWWLDHLPRVAGETDDVSNNWWRYILNPDDL